MANRLINEDSPYLQQHKDNPVDWYPWCDEAFLKAQEENKAIFISIGYSSCHWCHVMEEEVFQNDACAKVLNEHFISIKVDRQERPDIDKHYQEVYQLLNRRAGGWPTSIFCTPQNKPFFAGTYIPAQSQAGSMQGMGFLEISTLIADKIAQNDPKLFENADQVSEFIGQRSVPKEATILKEDFIKNFMLQVKNNYDTKHGGFFVAPKFPQAPTLLALLHSDMLYKDKAARAMVQKTLYAMRQGGFYDLVDGGFCRYSVDDAWFVPHFEKMLYDNALLCEIYTLASIQYNEPSFLQTAKECADFWQEHMSEEKLFYSASDADSEGQEGSYYLYTYEELHTALTHNGFENVEQILQDLSVTQQGNFEGKNIIRFETQNPPASFQKVKAVLRDLRTKRDYPLRDKKIQTSWSAMMIRSLFLLGSQDPKYILHAQESLDALLKTIYPKGVLYHTTLIHKEPKIEAFLEDYAFLASALLAGYKQTQEEEYLYLAQVLSNTALEKFYNNAQWLFSIGEFETKAEISDTTYTSCVSVMCEVLLSLATLLDDDKYSHFAFKTFEFNSYELARRPVYYPFMLIQTLRYLKGDRIIKADIKNIVHNTQKLSKLRYPFVLYKTDTREDFMVCGAKSCFANTSDLDALDSLLTNSF